MSIPPAPVVQDDPPPGERPTATSSLEDLIGEAYEVMRALHEAGEIE